MRRRIVIRFVAVLTAAVVAFAVPLAIAVRGLLVDRGLDGVQASLEQTAIFVDDRARTCSDVDLMLGTAAARNPDLVVALFDRDGELLATSTGTAPTVGAEVDVAAAGNTGRRHGAGALAVAVPLSTRACSRALLLQASIDDAGVSGQIRQAQLGILGVAAAVLLLAVGVALATADRLTRPLVALAASATRLGEGDFGERAPRSGLPEPDAIADALDLTAERLDRATERSRSFTADASHQLRTPLTALRLQLELAEAALDGEVSAAALREAQSEVDRIEGVVDELVTLTDLGASEVEIDLGAVVRDAAEGHRPLFQSVGREIEIDVRTNASVFVRPGAIRQAVQVLLENALSHGQGTVSVVQQPTLPDAGIRGIRIIVTDEGEGPVEHAVRWLTARDRADLPPLQGGRGLLLARRLIEGEGGRLTVTAGDPRIVITLPQATMPMN